MTLTSPIYLWSLLGLAVPIAIHFLSRKEGKVIKLGSIRHVQETSTQQFRGIRLNEILLLILRCALIVILSLMLGGLHFNQKNGKWIVIEKGTEKNKNVKVAIDSLKAHGYEAHWLADGFPSIESSRDSLSLNYWSVIHELENQNPEEAIIFSFTKSEKFKGKKKGALPANVKIIPVETEPKKFLLEAVKENDSIYLRIGTSNFTLTSFENRKEKFANDSIKSTAPRKTKIMLVSDKAREQEKLILKAAIRAIDKSVSSSFLVLEKSPAQFAATDSADWLFWISNERLPDVKIKTLRWNPTTSDKLVEQSKKNEWILTQPLTEEIVLDKNLTLLLASLITSDSTLQKITSANDQRTLPETMAWTYEKGQAFASVAGPTSVPTFLIILFVSLVAFERYLSYRKNQ